MTDIRADHARYEEWDAAYVLGALSPAERRDFENHLADCGICTAAVAQVAAMPGLLGRLSADDAFALLAEPEAMDAGRLAGPRDSIVSLARAAVRRRRRARGLTIAAFVAAAAVVFVALVVQPVIDVDGRSHPDTTVTLAETGPGPFSATVAFTSHRWGTSIDMSCSYREWGEGYGGGDYALYVTDATGTATRVTSWWAKPGDDVRLTAATDVRVQDIRSVELRDATTGSVLLSSRV